MTNAPEQPSPLGKTTSSEVRREQIDTIAELAERASSDVMDASVDIMDAAMHLKNLRQALDELR